MKIQLALRGDVDMEDSLRKSAAEHGWTLSEEIRMRLWFSFSEGPTKHQLMAAPNRAMVKQRYEEAWRNQPGVKP